MSENDSEPTDNDEPAEGEIVLGATFPIGMLLATPGALAALNEAGQRIGEFLCRHVARDWGELCDDDRRANDYDADHGGRLLAEECEVCGTTDLVEVHHVRKLADLRKKGRKELPDWAKIMIIRRRKTPVLCRSCHGDVHAGRPLPPRNSRKLTTGEPR